MVLEVNNITEANVAVLIRKTRKAPQKTLADMYGKLKRGIDGLAYQKAVRNEWC